MMPLNTGVDQEATGAEFDAFRARRQMWRTRQTSRLLAISAAIKGSVYAAASTLHSGC